MNSLIKNYFFLILILLLSQCQSVQEKNIEAHKVWDKIEPFFSVPEEYKDQFGEYRSPLKFYNGKAVKNKKDWKRRREEILTRWHEMMGAWPPFIKDQELEIIDSVRKENFTQYRISFNWTKDEKREGYLLVPDGEGIKPAVITVYYYPEAAIGLKIENRDYAYQLTKRGFITLSIGVGEKDEVLYYPNKENASIQPISMQAYVTANAWYALTKFQDVDSTKIGIVGQSYGGKWAMFTSCLFDKFACAAWSAPGIVLDETFGNCNYWDPWYLGYHQPPWRERGKPSETNPAKGLYPKLMAEGYNLHELHALMAPRPFLVSAGTEDPPRRWIPLNHTIEVNRLLGFKNRVAMTNRKEHAPSPESNEQIYLFFEYFLKYNGISEKSNFIIKR